MQLNTAWEREAYMNSVNLFLQRNLSALIFLAIYLVMTICFLFLEGFQTESQLNLITIILPCLLLGIILDFILSRNSLLNNGQKNFTRILPSGIFLMYFITILFNIADRSLPDYYNNFYYLFISGPFMIASYQKQEHRNRMIFSLIGTVTVFAFYLYLTTKTEHLDKGFGLFIFMLSYFMMFYSASAIRKLTYLPILLGIMNTVVLWYLYQNPVSADGLPHSWDYDYLLYFEYIMLGAFVVCILVRLLAEFISRSETEKVRMQ